MSALSIRDVTFTYLDGRSPALDRLSLDVPAGQICGVVGRAGAGKTTLCALCAGFIPHFHEGEFHGAAQVDGQNVVQKTVSELVRHVGLVSSNPFSQISGARFTVYEEVALALENLGVPRAEIVERVDWAIEVLGIAHLRDRSPYALSGGQQQRMVIAGTLALRPPLLVLDEPTTQLDPPSIEDLAQVLRDLARQGTTVLFAEHRLEWTAALAERVVVLDQGALVADGPPASVLTDPALRERGVGWPRPALFAEQLRAAGTWPAERPLPVTEEGLLEGIQGGGVRGQGSDGSGQQPAPTHNAMSSSALASRTLTSDPRPLVVALDNVRFSYPSGVEALRGVSLEIGRGERVAILGRNGAGKSTLVRHLNGLLQPSSGLVKVDGVDTGKTTVARCARHVGIVFQDVRNQLFARTVRDELRFGPRNLRYGPEQVEALVDRALAALDLADVADEHPYDLTLAQRRLVAIAAVLAMDTPVLVLDEPTAGLDGAAVDRLAALARDRAAEGKSVVVVSHDLDFCYEALDRVVLVRDGLVPLDTTWQALDPHGRSLLDETVGLPLGLRVRQLVGAGAPG